MAIVKDLGMVTAYAYAVAGGYEGTEAEFTEMLGQAGITLEQLENLTAVATTLSEGSEATASYSDGVLTFGIPQGAKGDKGDPGAKGDKGDTGDTGNGIASIAKTATVGLVDTYTITFTDGTTTTFTVTNGEDGTVTPEQMEQAIADALATFSGGTHENMTAGSAEQLLSTQYAEDSAPYLFRPTGGGKDVGNREYDEIVGGSVVTNQLVPDDAAGFASSTSMAVSISGTKITLVPKTSSGIKGAYCFNDYLINGHDYYVTADYMTDESDTTGIVGMYRNIGSNEYENRVVFPADGTSARKIWKVTHDNTRLGLVIPTAGTTSNKVVLNNVLCIDLTQMFGSTIADYAYTLEQSTAGSGIAWLKSYGFFGTDYIAYNAGTLAHVSGLTAHIMRDANNNVIGNYPLDSSLTLYGAPKLSNGQLIYDGDTYESNGTVNRRFRVVDPSTFNWQYYSSGSHPYFYAVSTVRFGNGVDGVGISDAYPFYGTMTSTALENNMPDKMFGFTSNSSQKYIYVKDSAYTNAADFKASLAGKTMIYLLASTSFTPEQAEPYQSPQICDPSGTEQYTGSAIPVGHSTQYPADLKGAIERVMVQVPEPPTADGTYTLKCTVTASGASYAWTADT